MDNKRKQISKKLRFDVFKRDNFTCLYCGKMSPNVALEVDHIIPVCKSGKNNIDNLATSCFDCNRGKGGKELNILPQTTADKLAKIKEIESQYREFKKWNDKIRNRVNSELEQINDIYQMYFEDYHLTDSFKNSSLKSFIEQLGVIKVEDFMHKACSKINHSNGAIKYFCGICWNQIRENNG